MALSTLGTDPDYASLYGTQHDPRLLMAQKLMELDKPPTTNATQSSFWANLLNQGARGALGGYLYNDVKTDRETERQAQRLATEAFNKRADEILAPVKDTGTDAPAQPTTPGGGDTGGGDLTGAVHHLESRGRMEPGIFGDYDENHRPMAFGPMQVHAGALAEANKAQGTNYTLQELADKPDIGRQVGETYLQQQFKKYGRADYALGAYNAGPGAMDAAIASGKGIAGLPPRTQQYVAEGLTHMRGGGQQQVAGPGIFDGPGVELGAPGASAAPPAGPPAPAPGVFGGPGVELSAPPAEAPPAPDAGLTLGALPPPQARGIQLAANLLPGNTASDVPGGASGLTLPAPPAPTPPPRGASPFDTNAFGTLAPQPPGPSGPALAPALMTPAGGAGKGPPAPSASSPSPQKLSTRLDQSRADALAQLALEASRSPVQSIRAQAATYAEQARSLQANIDRRAGQEQAALGRADAQAQADATRRELARQADETRRSGQQIASQDREARLKQAALEKEMDRRASLAREGYVENENGTQSLIHGGKAWQDLNAKPLNEQDLKLLERGKRFKEGTNRTEVEPIPGYGPDGFDFTQHSDGVAQEAVKTLLPAIQAGKATQRQEADFDTGLTILANKRREQIEQGGRGSTITIEPLLQDMTRYGPLPDRWQKRLSDLGITQAGAAPPATQGGPGGRETLGPGVTRIPPQGGYQPPQAETDKMLGGVQELRNTGLALRSLQENPGAVGPMTQIFPKLQQWMDSKGVITQAAVDDIGSQLRHARSGGAVTDSEFAYLHNFVPQAGDPYEVAMIKTQRLHRAYGDTLADRYKVYGPGNRSMAYAANPAVEDAINEFRFPAVPKGRDNAQTAKMLDNGATYTLGDGKTRAKWNAATREFDPIPEGGE